VIRATPALQRYAALGALIALVVFNALFTPHFATAGNLWNVLLQVARWCSRPSG
jgi:ribose/xylose/arabinose/galactoside ABC-type transport system permease subunit